jgi:hypothetical protein
VDTARTRIWLDLLCFCGPPYGTRLDIKAIESLGINGVRNITGRRWHRRIPCSRSMKGDSTFPF